MNELKTFLQNESMTKFSMMRLLCLIVTVGGLPILYIHPEQSPYVCSMIGLAIAGKWLADKVEK
jgi:hypothetical protein